MSSTTHKTDVEYIEHFDLPDVLNEKIELLAKLITESKHFIAFTGAGISTAAGVPDFRSGLNTVLDVGAGAWTKRDAVEQGKILDANAKGSRHVSTLAAIPTFTHQALVKLNQVGMLKYLISQNTDGLHRRSGFPPEYLSELHGNSNLEICKTCGKQYLRDFKCRIRKKGKDVHNHETGRKCVCGGILMDSIINFGESLPEKAIRDGIEQGKQADLCVVLGSSLRVQPAADIPMDVLYRKTPLIIVNLQSTPLDNGPYGDGQRVPVRINAKCDDVMKILMQKLGLEVDPFILRRYITIEISHILKQLCVRGVDIDGVPFTLFTKVFVKFPGIDSVQILESEPFRFDIPKSVPENEFVVVTLEFFRHYLEPKLDIAFSLKEGITTFRIDYDPVNQNWNAPVCISFKA